MAGNQQIELKTTGKPRVERDKLTGTMFIDLMETTNKVDTFDGPLNGQVLLRIDMVEKKLVGVTILKYRKTIIKLAFGFALMAVFLVSLIWTTKALGIIKKWFVDFPKDIGLRPSHNPC